MVRGAKQTNCGWWSEGGNFCCFICLVDIFCANQMQKKTLPKIARGKFSGQEVDIGPFIQCYSFACSNRE